MPDEGERQKASDRRLADPVAEAERQRKHLESRGKKMAGSLRDLSKIENLTDHTQDILHEIEHQSDRGVALIIAANLEISLKMAMRARLVAYPDFEQTIFDKEGAPLSTFSDRIKIARGIGVIGEQVEAHLNCIRHIRNQFAHSPLKIDFRNELIAAEIENLLPDNPEWKPHWSPQKRRYVGTAVTLAQALEHVAAEHYHDTIPIWTS